MSIISMQKPCRILNIQWTIFRQKGAQTDQEIWVKYFQASSWLENFWKIQYLYFEYIKLM